MNKILIFFIIVLLSFNSFGQSKSLPEIVGLTIDPNIKNEVEKNIKSTQSGYIPKEMEGMMYENILIAEIFEDDKPKTVITSNENKKSIFKSFYYWQNNTIGIDGAFGMYTGIGFSIKIENNKATVYHLLSADEIPSYAYTEKDNLIYRLEVPCTETKIILSEIPDNKKQQIIYGYVEFKSNNYYQSNGSIDEKEISPRKKERANMKIYFKSIYLEL